MGYEKNRSKASVAGDEEGDEQQHEEIRDPWGRGQITKGLTHSDKESVFFLSAMKSYREV